MKRAIALLEKHNLLKIISDELDINLEIPHIAYVTVTQIKSHDEFSLYLFQTNSGSSVDYAFSVQISVITHSRCGWRRYWCRLHP